MKWANFGKVSLQGRTEWKNCRLTPKDLDCQLGWSMVHFGRVQAARYPEMQFSFYVLKILT